MYHELDTLIIINRGGGVKWRMRYEYCFREHKKRDEGKAPAEKECAAGQWRRALAVNAALILIRRVRCARGGGGGGGGMGIRPIAHREAARE